MRAASASIATTIRTDDVGFTGTRVAKEANSLPRPAPHRQTGVMRAHARSVFSSEAHRRRGASRLTPAVAISSIVRLMSADAPKLPVPDLLDAWRMVSGRRGVQGRAPLASLSRLAGSLFDTDGEVAYTLDFGTDELQLPFAELRATTQLPLLCQRTLTRFLFPVDITQRLGLIRQEADEAALPENYEPLLMPVDGMLSPLELIEDELILAIPVVPVKPGTEAMEADWPIPEDERERASPFSALSALKNKLDDPG